MVFVYVLVCAWYDHEKRWYGIERLLTCGDLYTPTFARLSAFSSRAPCFGGAEPRPTQLLTPTAMAEAAGAIVRCIPTLSTPILASISLQSVEGIGGVAADDGVG